MYQYLKLQKKIAAGANYAITQLGYDAGKFRELKLYLDDNIGTFPVLGNVYVLNSRVAQKMAKGDLAGCWVSPKLQNILKTESQEADKGLMARLERDGLVDGWYKQIRVGDQSVRERHYRITANGTNAWNRTRAFYETAATAAIRRGSSNV